MRKTMIGVLALAAVAGVVGVPGRTTQAQTSPSSAAAPHTTLLAAPSDKLEDALLEWPLPPGEQAYGKIGGKHLHQYVEEQAAISRRYRDQGHPRFWGRIIGTSADAESAEWLANKFKSFGLSDVRIQPLDLGPQRNSAFRCSPNRIHVRRRAISDGCIASRRGSRRASSSTTSTPIVKRPTRYRGRVSRRPLGRTPRSSTK